MNPTMPSRTAAGRLVGHWLFVARAAWLGFAALVLVTLIASLPVYYTQVQIICRAAGCPPWQITADYARTVQHLGFSLSGWAAFQVGGSVLIALAAFSVVAVIFWRRSDERIALVVAVFLLTLASDLNSNLEALAMVHPGWTLPVRITNYANSSSWWFVFALFPDGRFVPRWTRWFAFGFALLTVPEIFFPGSPLDMKTQLGDLSQAFLAVQGFCLVGIQIYRYVRVSTLVQRQQTKWVVFGIATTIVIGGAISIADPSAAANQAPHTLVDFLAGMVTFFLFFLIPLSIGIAILRYRLWDVDALINKALVYGLLTALLGALYAGLIIGLGSLVGVVSGRDSQPLVLVMSTLAIAALFLPARRRVQRLIDRRFYRKRYDAEKTLAGFSATLRSEVHLEQVREQLLAVVNETMQPEHVSLWLAQPERRPIEQAHRLETPAR